MKGFALGVMCGAGAVCLLGSSLALAQGGSLPMLMGTRFGLWSGSVLITCTNAEGQIANNRRMMVVTGGESGPSIALRCQ